jgi:hypothetical protein
VLDRREEVAKTAAHFAEGDVPVEKKLLTRLTLPDGAQFYGGGEGLIGQFVGIGVYVGRMHPESFST